MHLLYADFPTNVLDSFHTWRITTQSALLIDHMENHKIVHLILKPHNLKKKSEIFEINTTEALENYTLCRSHKGNHSTDYSFL